MIVILNKGKRNTHLVPNYVASRVARGSIESQVPSAEWSPLLSKLMVCQQPAREDFHYLFCQMHHSLTVLWGIFRFLTSSLTNFVQGLIFDNFCIFLGIEAWTCFFPSHILISRNYFPFYIPISVPYPSLLPSPIHFLEGIIHHLVQVFNPIC